MVLVLLTDYCILSSSTEQSLCFPRPFPSPNMCDVHVMREHANLHCTTGLPREVLPSSRALGNWEGAKGVRRPQEKQTAVLGGIQSPERWMKPLGWSVSRSEAGVSKTGDQIHSFAAALS